MNKKYHALSYNVGHFPSDPRIAMLHSPSSHHPEPPKHVRKLPTSPRPLPIINNLHILMTLPHRGLQNLAKKYGLIMSPWLSQVPTVVISSPEAAELFLKTNDIDFTSLPKNVRKLCTLQLLSASKIEPFVAVRGKEVGSLVEWLKGAAGAREVVDMRGRWGSS
ncbi:Cytochrome P [Parasponia andersonii]|uniref:Cytochrome P n=1 Tax=Parasponia andersonii TaxID=3476 RepID=A0A2P5BGI0_PARAD|nr:Cytochrome P [Parasponia andersonii]